MARKQMTTGATSMALHAYSRTDTRTCAAVHLTTTQMCWRRDAGASSGIQPVTGMHGALHSFRHQHLNQVNQSNQRTQKLGTCSRGVCKGVQQNTYRLLGNAQQNTLWWYRSGASTAALSLHVHNMPHAQRTTCLTSGYI